MSIIKYENFSEEYILNESSIDQMAAKVEEFLYSLGMERANVLGIRLSIEEALLRWLDHFSAKDEETKVSGCAPPPIEVPAAIEQKLPISVFTTPQLAPI